MASIAGQPAELPLHDCNNEITVFVHDIPSEEKGHDNQHGSAAGAPAKCWLSAASSRDLPDETTMHAAGKAAQEHQERNGWQ